MGNDVEEPTDDSFPREVTKASTSSKKSDVPAKADPSRAKKAAKSQTANEAAAKTKNENRSIEGPSEQRRSSKPKDDRRSRTGKTDTSRRVRRGWGDDSKELDDEQHAEADAAAAHSADEAPEEPKAPVKSYEEYIQEQQAQQAALSSKPARVANDGDDEKWGSAEVLVKEQEVFHEGTGGKKTKQKARKEKNTIDYSPVFSDEVQRAPRTAQPPRRGGKRGGKAFGKPRSAQVPVMNEETFPALS